jgi:restriction system protein
MDRLDQYPDPVVTPTQFELEVKSWIDTLGADLLDYRSNHLEVVPAADGNYEIDVVARFSALGMDFKVLIECKHHKNPIKREVIQALHAKLASTGAQKAAVFSTSGFQSGAIEYANVHGIAVARVADGRSTFFARSFGATPPPPPAHPQLVAWLIQDNRKSVISTYHSEAFQELLFGQILKRTHDA